jgi:DHA2 family multidrug resistance protein
VVWEWTDAHPIVDLHLFRIGSFSVGTAAFCLGYMLFFSNLVILPLWLQTQEGYTATWAGLIAAPSGLVALVLSPFASRLMARADMRWGASFAFLMFAISFFMRARYTADASFFDFCAPLLVQGVALSTFMVAIVSITVQGLPPEKIPSGSGIMNFARITGGGVAASIAVTVWDRREILHQSRLAESSSAYDPALQHAMAALHALGLSDNQALGMMTHEMVAQAYLLSTTELAWFSGWASLALMVMLWIPRQRKTDAPAPQVAIAD